MPESIRVRAISARDVHRKERDRGRGDFRHPGIREAQVFGNPDKRYGEGSARGRCPTRALGRRPKTLSRSATDRLRTSKVPKRVRIVDELPMSVTGKPQKFVMREWMVKHGNADGESTV